jgi:hypothetical protein
VVLCLRSQDSQLIRGSPNSYAIPAKLGFWNESFNNHTNMLMLSYDGGKTFSFVDLKTSTDQDINVRYASFPSPKVGFVVSGKVSTRKSAEDREHSLHAVF